MESKAEMYELTVASQRAGLSPKQALRLVTLGVLPGEKREGRWFVQAKAVDEYAAKGPTEAATSGARTEER